MDQRIIQLYGSFTHGGLSRRGSLTGSPLAGSAAAATALCRCCRTTTLQAAIVPENDARLAASGHLRLAQRQDRQISGPPGRGGQTPGRDRHPRGAAALRRASKTLRGGWRSKVFWRSRLICCRSPAARRLMKGRARALHSKTNQADILAAALAAVPFLRAYPESDGNVGAIGFCFGGTIVNEMAAMSRTSKPWSRTTERKIPAAQVPAIGAPLLLHYGGLDERVNAGIPAYEAALKANSKRYTIYIYPGAQHAFNQRNRRGALQ